MRNPKIPIELKQRKLYLNKHIAESFSAIAEHILSSTNKKISLIRINKKEVAFKIRNSKFLLRATINLSENKISYNTHKMFSGKWVCLDYLDMVGNDSDVKFVNGKEISTIDRFGFRKHNFPFGSLKNFAKNYIDEMIIWEANFIS